MDKAKETAQELEGKAEEAAGANGDNTKLEAAGTDESVAGKAKAKLGQFNHFWVKQ
jgi:uncharacterized protein YjbJ (UPF0337 family)